jgi:hypothetical protein
MNNGDNSLTPAQRQTMLEATNLGRAILKREAKEAASGKQAKKGRNDGMLALSQVGRAVLRDRRK